MPSTFRPISIGRLAGGDINTELSQVEIQGTLSTEARTGAGAGAGAGDFELIFELIFKLMLIKTVM